MRRETSTYFRPSLAFSLLLGIALSGVVTDPGWPAEKVRVIVPEFSMGGMPIFVAKERGFFKGSEIESEIIRAPSHIGIQALIAGGIDFLGAGNTPIRARLQGAPVKVVGVMLERALYWLYARPALRTISMLRGATIGVPTVGTIIEAMTNILLEKHGLKSSDVIYRGLGGSSFRLQALRQGLIDATILGEPYNLGAKKSGYAELSFFGDEVPLSGTVVSTTEKITKEKPDLVRRFMLAVIRGNLFVKAERIATITLLRKWTGVEEELAKETYDLSAPFISETGIQERSSMATDVEIQRRVFRIESNPPLDQIFDFSFAIEAGKALK